MVVFIVALMVILLLAAGWVFSNRRLTESQERYRALVEATSDWIWEMDAQGRYTYASPMVESFLGYRPEEVVGRALFDFMPAAEARRLGELFAGVVADKKGFSGLENINLHKGGRQVVLEMSGVPVLGAMGELLGYRGIGRDITERRRTERTLVEYREHLEEQVTIRTAELRENKNQLDSIIENLPAVFCIKDSQGRYLRVNRCFEEAAGMARPQIIGHDDREIFPEPVANLMVASDQYVLIGAAPYTFETTAIHPDGSKHDYLTTKLPLFDGGGHVNGLIGISTDISRVKQLQWDLAVTMDRLKRRSELEQLVSGITSRMIGVEPELLEDEIETALAQIGNFTAADRCYLIELDASGDYFSITHQWCAAGVASTTPNFQNIHRESQLYMTEMLDYGMTLDIKDVDDLPPEAHALRQLIDAGSSRSILMLPVIYGGYLRGVIGLDSLQVRSGWNAEDLDLLKTLAVLLGQVLHSHENQRALRAAKDEAERLARVKSEFLANMSHEIRTPLHAVLGLAQIGVRDSAGGKDQQSFQRILDSGQHLLGLVNDILDLSRFDAGKFTLERVCFNLGDVIDRAVGFIADRAYAQGLGLMVCESPALPAQIEGDPMRLTQVLGNLLGNALKFTRHGRIVLEVETRGATLVLRVWDTGIGMTAEQLSRLFTPFEQADSSTTRRFGGSGLGLAISERLVRAMGGGIHVTSQVDVGSVFEVRLPLINPAPVAQEGQAGCAVVQLLGVDGVELDDISRCLGQRGIRAEPLSSAAALTLPATGVLLLGKEGLQSDEVVVAVTALLNRGGHVTVLSTPGEACVLPEGLSSRVAVVERPFRLRHLLRGILSGVERKPRESTLPRLTGLRILVAEDTEVNRIILEDLLDREGARVVFAENGQQALEQLQAVNGPSFDLVLMDIQMPVMDGYEATRQIQRLRPRLPVLGLTAHAFVEDKERCLAAGMVAHLSKPIEVETLVTAILKHSPPGRGVPVSLTAGGSAVSVVSAPAVEKGVAADLLDWVALNERYNGRQAFIEKLLTSACNSCGKIPSELRQAAAERNFDRLFFIAHSVKGTAGNLMASAVAELARETEVSARGQDPRSFTQAIELADLLAKLLELIADKLTKWSGIKQ